MAAAVAVSPSPSRRWWTSYTSMATPCRIPTLVNMNILWMYFLLALLRLDLCGGLPRTVRIGGIFEQEFRSQELVFKYAIEKINSRRDLLPFTKLTYDVKETPRDDSFVSAKHVCRQMKDGVAAIFGPMSDHSAAHVQSICDALEIPHVETRWDFRQDWDSYSINLYPHYRTLSRAYNDIITIWRWKSFTILYQTNEGLVRLQDLLRGSSSQQVQVTVRRLEPTDEGDYRPIFKEIEKRGETRIVIDCEYYEVHEILKQAQSLAMMTQYYHYFLTTLDLHLVDLSDYQYGGSNITGLRLVDPENPRVIQVTNEWQQIHDRTGLSPLENERGFRTATALMYDAVHVFARGLDDLSRAQDIEVTPLSCNRRNGWEYGNSLLNYMKMAEVDGLTGRVRYDNDGLRTRVVLELVELGNGQLEKVGYWDWRTGVNITKDYSKVQETVAASLQNKTLVVTTILEAPYVMLKNEEGLEGNDRYEGFCVDMLKEIADIIKFNYTIREVADGQYGAPAEDGETWSGMVGELITKKADLAVASLTISYIREQVIDFTKPFMNLGISILFKVPEKQNPSLFSFLSPLSFDIWICMLAAYLVVSFMLFVLARFSPYEWYNPHPCNPDSDVVENQFTLLNSLWFTIGSLMQQGSEVAPRAISTRLVSGMWWFFTLIMISSYTANLAAFLTVERMTSPIENQDDLARQTEIKYGPVYGGSTMTFFKNSHIQTYEKMWHFMSSTKPSVFVNSTKEGIERVRKGNYAYLVESTMNEYVTARNCDLMQVGGLLDSKGYGIGTPRGSPYRDLISNAILKLAESQTLQHLYNVWWKEKGAKQCQQDEKKKDANALAIANVGGVFVVLLAGLFLSLIVAVLEFMWKTNKNADVDREPICKEMADELRFAVRCLGSSKKPVKKRRYAEPPVNLPPDYYVDTNGTTLMPLTGGMIMPKKESYA